MKRRILITGSTGFVGKAVSKALLKNGHTVYSLVYDGEPALGTIPIMGDITRPKTLKIPEIDALVHCAGILESSHAPEELMFKVNLEGTRNITTACHAAGMKDMVFMSTISAVGPQGRSGSPIKEDVVPRPDDAYGRSKIEAENFLKDFQKRTGINISVIRPPVLYGENMNPGSSAMKTFENVRSGKFPLVKNGIYTFNFLYVGNLSCAIVLLLEKSRHFEIYNVNEGPYRAVDVIDTISRSMGIEKGCRKYSVFVLYIYQLVSRISSGLTGKAPKLSRTKYKALTTDVWKMDHSKIKHKVGFEPHFSLSEGVKRTVAFYHWNR